ncbi:OsmC family protein [Legionella sp. km772]|uniref:OsmC family protein n=1 Tax=Legionella sp. km772 TaxID=2498111 RepID=UPI000F8EFB84|nr:OsmC family protein [Legionella sp. km772]RUR05117.1 OsmC family peroxiredoxin [Legionella sp. km772]
MLMYNVHLDWKRDTEDFKYNTYNRKHTLFFNGGPKIEVNSSSNFIRNPQFHSPEELLIASLSSCMLLTFLSICCKQGYVVNDYFAQGYCHLDVKQHCISDLILCPVIKFEPSSKPDTLTLKNLFEQAHKDCFIANSLKVNIRINPSFAEE